MPRFPDFLRNGSAFPLSNKMKPMAYHKAERRPTVRRKHNRWTSIASAIAAFCAISSAMGSYLEQDPEREPVSPPERILPPPRPRNEISDLISRIRVGRPYSARNLTVFPLMLTRPDGFSEYRTLDEALSRGYVEILEEKSPDVREVLVRNNSRYHVFLTAGEALGGGKQNRLIAEDVLLGPHGPVVRVPVYCIEKGRWSPGEKFGSGGFMAPMPMRKMAQERVSQRALWDAVSGALEESGTRAENEDFSAVYRNDAVAAEIAGYRRDMRIPLENTVGCVVVMHGRIVGSDMFSSPELFRNLWPKLLDSYALGVITHRGGSEYRRAGLPSEDEVRRFLDGVFRASFRDRGARDIGRIVEVAGPGIQGEGLVHRHEVVHVHLNPRYEVRF